MSYVDLEKKPEYLGLNWYILTTLTIIFSFPYRMYLSSISGKVQTNIHKAIFTSEQVNDNQLIMINEEHLDGDIDV